MKPYRLIKNTAKIQQNHHICNKSETNPQQIHTKITQSSTKLHQTYCISHKKAVPLQPYCSNISYVIRMLFL